MNSTAVGRRPATIAAYVAGIVADGRERLLAEEAALRAVDADVEAVHRARVATRRLRSDLKTLRPVVDPVWAEQLRADLRWAGERLGAVRDADVLIERLERHAAAVGLPGVAGLVAVAAAQRADAGAELRIALDSPRWTTLRAALEAPPVLGDAPQVEPVLAALPAGARHRSDVDPGTSVRRALPALVARPVRRLRREVRALAAHPDDEALHEVRIRTKEVRYAAEAAAPSMRRAAKLAAAAKDLQTVLGDHHDAVVAEQWLRHAADRTDDPAVAFAAGVLVGVERAEQDRARRAWRRCWRTVRHASARVDR